jgi:hypothetical protein
MERGVTRREFLKGLAGLVATGIAASSCTVSSNVSVKGRSDFEKYSDFMNGNGSKLVNLYRESSSYPGDCTDISLLAHQLLEREGLTVRTVEGSHYSTQYSGGGWHVFNVIRLDGRDYILDFTKNQFTMSTEQVVIDGILHLKVKDASKGIDSIPYLIGVEEGLKEYRIDKEFESMRLSKTAFEISQKIRN